MATAPSAIQRLADDVLAKCPKSMGARFSGIVGDRAHSFGYHLAPVDLPDSDYSLQSARDRRGARAHPGMASALDISFDPDGMIAATRRLVASAKDPDDPRLNGVVEFCGTLNGTDTYPYSVDDQSSEGLNSWDDSHLWHCHISIHRDVCDDYDAIKGVADVLAGIPLTEEFTVDAEAKAAFAALNKRLDSLEAKFAGSDGHSHTVESTVAHVTQGLPWKSQQGTAYPALAKAEPEAQA